MTTPPPDWIADLVIYEVNPRGFTSPHGVGDGSGSGTFDSLRHKMPYLRDLGVNAIWLAGYCLATKHFYGIWSVYANVRPDRFDPVLGDADEFRELVDSAHQCGIRVFLDVISHGVLESSPLVEENPHWFDGGSWRMRDYDYTCEEFRQWWVQVWLSYVLEFSVDGFRVDVSLGDPSLWDEITERAAAAGKPIVVFGETEAYHFQQLSTHFAHGHELVVLQGAEEQPFEPPAERTYCTDVSEHVRSTSTRYSSVEVSCHDAGWKSPPGNYYVVRGSRFRFGYGALFAPHIPIFFGGEEFDAGQVSLPDLARDLYGTGGPGGWLYGTQLPWGELELPPHQAMLADTRRMLQIRREERELLNGDRDAAEMITVLSATDGGPKPYARYVPDEKAIVVVGNDTQESVSISLDIPLARLNPGGAARYRVTDLRTEEQVTLRPEEIAHLTVHVGADRSPGGGVRAIKVEPIRGTVAMPNTAPISLVAGLASASTDRFHRRRH